MPCFILTVNYHDLAKYKSDIADDVAGGTRNPPRDETRVEVESTNALVERKDGVRVKIWIWIRTRTWTRWRRARPYRCVPLFPDEATDKDSSQTGRRLVPRRAGANPASGHACDFARSLVRRTYKTR